MAIKVFQQYRIRRNQEYAASMKKLTDSKIFAQLKDIMMVSAIIGYNNNRFVPFAKSAEPVLMQFFKENDYDIIDLISFAYRKEQRILKEEEKYTIFESFANGGYPILLSKLGLEDIDNIDSFSSDQVRTIQKKYYSLLISGSFLPEKIELSDGD